MVAKLATYFVQNIISVLACNYHDSKHRAKQQLLLIIPLDRSDLFIAGVRATIPTVTWRLQISLLLMSMNGA